VCQGRPDRAEWLLQPEPYFLPLAYALRATWTYRRIVLGGGSVAIAAIAGVWLAERALNLQLISG